MLLGTRRHLLTIFSSSSSILICSQCLKPYCFLTMYLYGMFLLWQSLGKYKTPIRGVYFPGIKSADPSLTLISIVSVFQSDKGGPKTIWTIPFGKVISCESKTSKVTSMSSSKGERWKVLRDLVPDIWVSCFDTLVADLVFALPVWFWFNHSVFSHLHFSGSICRISLFLHFYTYIITKVFLLTILSEINLLLLLLLLIWGACSGGLIWTRCVNRDGVAVCYLMKAYD